MTAQLTSVTPTAITGNFTVPADAAFGKWLVNVSTFSGGTSISPIVFTVPRAEHADHHLDLTLLGFQNSTITFTLAGTNFQIGTFGSNVSFFNQTYDTYGINMTANLTSVSPTSITGTGLLPVQCHHRTNRLDGQRDHR